ncbi:helix-turn-helix domain-containing protein [Lysinibacillus sp. BSL11]
MRIKLKEVMKERGLTQLKLAEMTGIRQAAISEIVNNRRDTINKSHLETICKALEINDFNEILEWE